MANKNQLGQPSTTRLRNPMEKLVNQFKQNKSHFFTTLVRLYIFKHLLHIFAVASNSAFGTVAIFIYEKQDTVKCSFGLSKSHLISANSKISIPRLELQAAVMATRLKVSLLGEIKENITQLLLWSDSKTVLNHLRNKDKEILEIIKHTESTKHTITQHLMIGIMY